jgi:O-antigen/teichoic acid export membrane protein
MTYPTLVYTFLDARSGEASVKFLSESLARNERYRVLAICKLGYVVDFAIASLAFLVVAVSAHWAATSIAKRSDAAWLIIIYTAAFIPQALVGTSRAVLTVLGRFRLIATVETVMTLLRVVMVLGLVLSGWQVAGLVWGNAIAMFATGLLFGVIAFMCMLHAWGASPFEGDWQALKGRRREILGFMAYNDVNAILGMIPKQLDVLILGYFRGPVETGYYKLAKSLSGAVGYLAGPLQSVTYPEFARLSGAKNRRALPQIVRQLAFQAGMPLGLVTLAGTFLMSFILPILVGDAYLPAITSAQLLLCGTAVWLTFFWLRHVYFSVGNIRHWTIAIGVYASAFLVLSVPLTIELGYIGMTIASSVVVIALHLVMAARLIHYFKQQRQSDGYQF